jgi:hypothetical protein
MDRQNRLRQMEFLQDRLNVPKRLSSRLWLLTLPAALISFERRLDLPRIPASGARPVGLILLVGAAALGIFSIRAPRATIAYDGPLAPVVQRPAISAGLLALGGIGFMTRSTLLTLYSLALALAAGSGQMEIEEPGPSTLLGDS